VTGELVDVILGQGGQDIIFDIFSHLILSKELLFALCRPA
jgi:hypothetical protein